MRKYLSAILAVMLIASLAACALASPDLLYTNSSKVRVYESEDTGSKVIMKLKGGRAVLVDVDDGDWVGVLVEDTKHGGQMLGWIQAKYLTASMPEKYCKHDWSSWTVDKAATCTKAGLRHRVCSICGKYEEQTLKKLGHTFGKWTVLKKATCSKEGKRVRTCSVCGYEDEEVYTEPHDFGAWRVTQTPTCTAEGKRVRVCEECGYRETQSIEKTPHDYEWDIIVEATDHSSGTRAQVCQVCGITGEEESYDPEGTLRRRDRGEAVRSMQQLLVDQGYLSSGGADGAFGGSTEKALIQFQKDQGLNPDGIAWPQTIKRLSHDFGPWQTVKEMTRAEPGERVRVCKDCGYEQRETIESGATFERGRRGEDIRALQQIVRQLGYDAGSCDGIYGRKLDAAVARFAKDRGLVVTDGRIRPADIDAIVNAWFENTGADAWKGEGDTNSPINLALTVMPSGEADDDGVTTYSWTLTNLGSQKAMFNALLLTFGGASDFRKNDLVMVLDGVELKANCGNSASGTFSADRDWGKGDMNFAAMAVSEKTGDKWLSNTVTFRTEAATGAKTVSPQSVNININALADGEYEASFDRGDISNVTSGVYINAIHIYTMDTYDPGEIDRLAAGDTIIVSGEPIKVETVERDAYTVTINGGIDEGDGCELMPLSEHGAYRVLLYDDFATYTDQGVTMLKLDTSATYTDASDIDNDPVTVEYSEIASAIAKSENEYFDQYNTRITIRSGKIVKIHRDYVP